MKNSVGTTDTIYLTLINRTCFSSPLKHLLPATRNLFSSYKEQIQICLATVAIGTVFLGAFFVFLTQLAKYGW